MVPCRINAEGIWSDACIHNVSSRGLMLSTASPPRTGSYVDIRRGTLVIIGRVIWVKGQQFGVHTQDQVSAAILVSEPVLKQRPKFDTADDRRAPSREETQRLPDRRAEKHRRFASLFQYVFFAVAAAGFGAFVAMQVYHLLEEPFQKVASALGGGG